MIQKSLWPLWWTRITVTRKWERCTILKDGPSMSSTEQNPSIPLMSLGLSRFTFPGRGDKYSGMKWNFNHFTGVDYDAKTETTAIFKVSSVLDRTLSNYYIRRS